LSVTSGQTYFSETVRAFAGERPWNRPVRNVFLFGRKALWQTGAWQQMMKCSVMVAELNVRILSTWIAVVLRRLLGKPVLLWGHYSGSSGAESWNHYIHMALARHATGIVAYTNAEGRLFQRKLPGKKVFVAPNSCVLEQECVYMQQSDRSSILCVGRLVASKKPMLLLKAFCKAVNNLPSSITLTFIGDGEERLPMERFAKDAGIEQKVNFIGHTSDKRVLRNEYAKALFAVSPGYVGLSAIQALAHGVPLLVAREECHSPEIEACVENVNTIFFPSNNVDALSEYLVTFRQVAASWMPKRKEFARTIRTDYSIEQMARSFVDAIRHVTNKS
jgi:glycosyltransferase involved in cell wall biosynthesis